MRYSLIFTFLFIPFIFLLFFIKNEYLDKSIVKENTEFFISKDTSFEDVVNQLDSIAIDFHPLAKLVFNQFIEKKRLQYWYTSGRFMLQKGSSLNDVVNKLRSRSQDPTKLTFNSMDDIVDLFGIMDSTLDLDSLDMLNYLNLNNYPLDSLYLLLIPNTYELYWDISPKEFLNRMRLEYNNFWTNERINSANQCNLSAHEVFVLASIVDKEASHFDEMPTIAGLYINRIKIGWPLAADPTIAYIWRKKYNKSLRRIRNKHIEQTKQSKYNTYYHKGLPPFPICLPSLQSIEAVLHPEDHNFLFMCARPDNSEYHNFAKNHSDHSANAAKFHEWLNKRKIY